MIDRCTQYAIDVVEGRIIYDSFVLTTKAKGIYVSKTA